MKTVTKHTKKLFHFLFFISIGALYSCDSIALELPIIEKADAYQGNFQETDWLLYDGGKDYPSDVYSLKRESSSYSKPADWVLKSKTESTLRSSYKFRFTETSSQGRYLVQYSGLKSERYGLTFFIVKSENEIEVYAPRESLVIRKAKASYQLRNVQKYIKYSYLDDEGKEKETFVFTATACKYYKKEILAFVQDLNFEEDFKLEYTLVGTKDKNLVERIIQEVSTKK